MLGKIIVVRRIQEESEDMYELEEVIDINKRNKAQ